MKKSRNSDKLFPLYKHPTDALPAPNGADFGVWGHCPQQAFFASVLTLALLAGLFSKRPLVPDVLFNTSYSCILQSRYVKYFLHIFDCCIVLLSEGGEEMANGDERAGQPESMEQVIALYYDQIYKFCYWKTHSAVDAQDITQDTFIRFMDAAQTYSDIESPKALLYTIAHHLCLNWLKKVPPDSLDELRWDQEPAAEDFADHAIRKIYLSTAIAALPNEQQEVLLLRYGQDLKVGEIAEILGLSRFQVMYRMRGALRQLKKLLKEESP